MLTIIGPTASGKTAFATALAATMGAEIISADSRQVYRRMDIGTGKDLADYEVNGIKVPYHLIDIAEPGTKYNLFQYQQDFRTAYTDIVERGSAERLRPFASSTERCSARFVSRKIARRTYRNSFCIERKKPFGNAQPYRC